MIIRSARFLLTRLLFLAMGLPISRYRKEVEQLWSLSKEVRAESLGQLLARNRPLNSAGSAVGGLEDLRSSLSLSKKQFRNQSTQGREKHGKSGFGRHTAGTTGEPTQITLDRKELARMLAVRDYCFRHHGLKLGQREARLWGRPEVGIKSRLKNFVMNRRVFHPVGPEAKDEVANLLSWKPDYLYGYASLLLEAAQILDGMEMEFDPPKCVVCTAESILPAQKAYISRAFKAPVAEEYGSTEFDVIAFECTEGHRHLVNPWALVENTKDKGCIVTDVSRTSQSLVRYELGDYVHLESSNCTLLGSTEVIHQLEGRSINRFAYLSKDEKFHALEFARAVDRYQSLSGEVFEFTVYQYQYGRFELDTSLPPGKGSLDVSRFVSEYLCDVVGEPVNVVPAGEKTASESFTKKGYFIQAMGPDHEG
ncbi:CoF synthetase [Marinobacter sp. 71-i]|uniref:CoF synthetase n=1 Tax=Marinobacter iranensis TaxID=2962607 RepID=A0ABT5YEN8_9GAMM|nr:CoF synthetase [Marinobacter iranensis]MDF0752162.1 CoF synthetase [Marinobacter iranensis]